MFNQKFQRTKKFFKNVFEIFFKNEVILHIYSQNNQEAYKKSHFLCFLTFIRKTIKEIFLRHFLLT